MSWLNFNNSFKKFTEAGRNLPGTVVEVLSNKKIKLLLIGDIDPTASNSGDNKLIDNNDIIIRYKYVWKNPKDIY